MIAEANPPVVVDSFASSFLPLGAPVTIIATGVPGLTYGIYWDPTGAFRSEAINQLSQAGVPAESISVQLSLGVLGVMRSLSATVIVRASETFNTKEKISAAVGLALSAAAGNPVTTSIKFVGPANGKIDIATGGESWIDSINRYLADMSATVGGLVKWLIIIAIILAIGYFAVKFGAIEAARGAFA